MDLLPIKLIALSVTLSLITVLGLAYQNQAAKNKNGILKKIYILVLLLLLLALILEGFLWFIMPFYNYG